MKIKRNNAFLFYLASYEVMKRVAEKHKVGFFDASANDGDILFPNSNGTNRPIDRPDNLSSIQQIKRSASPGQENASVQEILYSKLNLAEKTIRTTSHGSFKKTGRKWWQRIFGAK
ncbi:MAG TPA: hypothetical protein VNS58_12460 [Puia sp.]|nr:hypothetical protein [Puia sp.]